MRKIFHPALFIAFIVAVFLFFLRPLSGDGDFYHHIATGRQVSLTHTLPRGDTWTFTAASLPWVAHSWLGAVLMYLVFARWSFPGIAILLAAVAALTLLLLFILLRRLHVSEAAAYALLAIAAPVIATRWPDRPELFAYPLIISLFIIEEFRASHPRLVLLFPLVTILWANLYGANVIVGIALLILFTAVSILTKKKSGRLYFFSVAAAIASAFVNGYGAKTVFYAANIPAIARYQGEWAGIWDTIIHAPVEYVLTFQYLVIIYLLYALLMLTVVASSGRAIKQKMLYTLAGFSVFVPFFAFRQAPLAVVLSLPLFGIALTGVKNSYRKIVIIFTWVFAGVSIGLSFWMQPAGLPRAIDPDAQALIRFVKTSGISGNTYNNQQLGGWLTYYLGDRLKTFVDTRDDLFLTTPVFSDIISLTLDSFLPLLYKYRVDAVIVDFVDGGPIYRPLFYSQLWVPVYLSNRFLVAIPRSVALAKNIPILSALDPFTQNGAKPDETEEALREYRLGNNPTYVQELSGRLQTQRPGIGPQAPLADIQTANFAFRMDLARSNCTDAQKQLAHIDALRRGKLLFDPGALLPSPFDTDRARFTIVCD